MKALFAELWKPAKTKEEAHRRMTNLAVVASFTSFLLLLVFFTVSTWVDADFIPKFKALFLLGAACFALLAVAILGAIALSKRNLY